MVTITAAPGTGAYFAGWSGGVNSSANPLNINITGDLSITGSFLPFPTYVINLATNGQGSISLNPSASNYYSNTTVTATATPTAGWAFAGWSGDIASVVNPLPIPVDSNVRLTGSFAQLPAFNPEPQGVTNLAGSTVSLSGDVIGTGPFSYEWYFAGNVDLGATNGSLIITNAQPANSGQYWLVASSPYGSVTSSIVSLLLTNSSGSTNIISVCDETGLRAAVAIGGWITIGCNGTITLTSPINITNNVSLDGANVSATISGGGVTRLFNVGPGAILSITNVTLADGCVLITSPTGTNADGGAIYNNGGTVNLISCTLSNNSAQALVGGGVARGGAIFNRGGQIYIVHSLMVSNYLIGGLYDPGYLTGAYNVGGTCLGGSVYNESGTVTMANDSIENNSLSAIGSDYFPYPGGTGLGGAVYNTNGTLAVVNCVVSNNVCSAQSGLANAQCMGGAFYQASGSLSITNSLIITNSALGGAGGSQMINSYPPLAAYGGGIAGLGGSVSLDHVSTVGNFAKSGGSGYHTPSKPAFGGGIYNQANLIAEYCAFSGNIALVAGVNGYYASSANGSGGALYNLGNAILDRCCVYSNLVQGSTGVYSENAPGNGGNGCGGAIFNGGQCSVTNTTIAFNTAVAGSGSSAYILFEQSAGVNGNAFGGGVYNDGGGIFSAWNVTIATNFVIATSNAQYSLPGSPGQAAGSQVDNNSGTLSLHNSILAYSGSNSNASGTITDNGYNISSDGSANFEGGSSYNFTDPLLGALANNGGPTLTMALLPMSPAIDSGGSSGAPVTDQRGYARPAGAGFDIGAFEYGAVPAAASTWINLLGGTNKYSLNFSANAGVTYILQTSTDLKTWTPWLTNGPFANPTNISQPMSFTNAGNRYFRLLIQ